MTEPILVGTDGSDTATAAVQKAIELAKGLAQPLHVVTAFKPLPAVEVPGEVDVRADSGAQSVLDDAKARARVAGLEATCHSRTGDPAEAVLEVAEEIGAGVIVVGNKGISSKRRFMLGNVPSKIVHHAPCSTFVVHTST